MAGNNGGPVVIEFSSGSGRRQIHDTVQIDRNEWESMTVDQREKLRDKRIAAHPGWDWYMPDQNDWV